MGRFGVGQAIVRVEDERLLTGGGRYTDDVVPEGQVAAVFVRSPHAHAEIRAVRTETARAMPGVLAVLTVDDLDAAGMGNLPCRAATRNRDGTPVHVPPGRRSPAGVSATSATRWPASSPRRSPRRARPRRRSRSTTAPCRP